MLELIAKHHSTWVGYLINNGCPPSIAEDIVQEMYLKIHKSCKTVQKIMFNDKEINHGYIRVTLLNLHRDYQRSKARFNIVSIDENEVVRDELSKEEYSCGVEREIELKEQNSKDIEFINRIAKAINSFEDSYHRNAARAYFLNNFTLREMAKETNITLTSLFNSVKHYKAMLKEQFGDELTEYLKNRK